jgi:peptidoglycan/LPS O-acetylase OafA/YrhL
MMYDMNNDLLTRRECTALRGLAILGIFLHNYCHWLGPVVKENEYQYFQHNVDWLAQAMESPDLLLPAHLISFFGHYGVPIFLFLSAYGLERKYGGPATISATQQQQPGVWPFLRYHFLKLFKMMIVGFICFTLIDAVTPGQWHYTVAQVVGQLGMFNNLYPNPDRNIWPGPFWFFGLMLQLYIVYRLLLYRRHWGWTVALMVVCTAVQLFLNPEGEPLNRWRYNFMGGMLPFGFGLLFARYGEKIMLVRMNFPSLLMCWVVTSFFIMGASDSFLTWTLVPALVCYAAVYFVKTVYQLPWKPLREVLIYVLEWLGNVSAALFIIHPAIRKVFIPISRHGDVYTGLLLYTIAALGTAWLVKEVMKKIPNPKL